MAEVSVSVFRKGPGDAASRYDEYRVDVQPTETVLDVLHDILYTQDPTLAFRRSCRSAICGSCAMRINGQARLACNTQASGLVQRDGWLLVEPMSNMAVLKDLVVEMDGFWKAVRDVKPSLVDIEGKVPEKGYVMPNEAFASLKIVSDCIMCGACLSDCTSREVNPKFLGPAALAKAYRFVGDPRDGATVSRLELYSQPNGIWDCDSCLYCNEVCPKGVKPLDAIMKMRELAIQDGIADGHGPRHAIAFYETVVKTGRLNEAATAMKSLGLLGFLKQVPVALTLAMRGKQPELRKKPIPGYDDVRTLITSVKRDKRQRRSRP